VLSAPYPRADFQKPFRARCNRLGLPRIVTAIP
jgi:hypothetical protein